MTEKTVNYNGASQVKTLPEYTQEMRDFSRSINNIFNTPDGEVLYNELNREVGRAVFGADEFERGVVEGERRMAARIIDAANILTTEDKANG